MGSEGSAGILSRLFFSWVDPLFVQGNKATLTQGDLLPLELSDAPRVVSKLFEGHLADAIAARHPTPVTAALFKQFRAQVISGGVAKFFNSSLNLLPPIVFNLLLKWLASAQAGTATNAWEGWVWACALFIALAARTLCENAYFHIMVRVGFQVRTAITGAVYRKALRLSPVARMETPVGTIVNLMQLDAQRLDTMCMQLHVTWDGAWQIIGNMVLLGIYIGPSALAGLGTMLLLIPLNMYFMRVMGAHRRKIVVENDKRVKVTNEVLQGIRAIKFYAWELFYTRRIAGIRDAELGHLRGFSLQSAVNSTLMQTAPVFVSIVTLTTFAASGGSFTPANVFTAIAILNQLRFPLIFYPMVVTQLADAKVSLVRLNKFIASAEVPSHALLSRERHNLPHPPNDVSITVMSAAPARSAPSLRLAPHLTPAATAANALPASQVGLRVSGTFMWEDSDAREVRLALKAKEATAKRVKEAQAAAKKAKSLWGRVGGGGSGAKLTPALADAAAQAEWDSGQVMDKSSAAAALVAPVLQDIAVSIPRGQLWALVGPVGIGKTALVSSALGELAPSPGSSVVLSGRVAYVSQTAYVLNATVKQNVTFAGDATAGGGGVARMQTAAHAAELTLPKSACKDEGFYEQVLDACALRPDLAILPAGDATEIGERGINLSGGQKQRVALARAAYARADVVLLDDPLSALDAEVGKHIFEHVIGHEGLMKGSTRLLVTNALQHLEHCDGIIVLAPGEGVEAGSARVCCAGSYAELIASSPFFRNLLHSFGHHASGDVGSPSIASFASVTSGTGAAGAAPVKGPASVGVATPKTNVKKGGGAAS